MGRSSTRVFVIGTLGCAVALAGTSWILVVLGRGLTAPASLRVQWSEIALSVVLLSFSASGALVAVRRPRSAVGWLLLLDGLSWQAGLLLQAYVLVGRYSGGARWPGTVWAAWILSWIWIPAVGGVLVVLFLFPDGRPASRWWRVVIAGAGSMLVLALAAQAVKPGELARGTSIDNPVGVGALGSPAGQLLAVAGPVLFALVVCSIGSLILRFLRGGTRERQQILWVAVAAVVVVAGLSIAAVLSALGLPDRVTSYFNVVPLAALPIAIAVAVVRHRLYDIDFVMAPALVSAGVTAFASIVYLVLVVGGGALFDFGAHAGVGVATLATGIVAVALQPLRARLGKWAGRVVLPPSPPPAETDQPVSGLSVLTLGGFRLIRDGELVDRSGWQSRKARTLLKILIARRGRPLQREAAMEWLWPEGDPTLLGNRLSVALATLRSVLDPEKRRPAQHYVEANRDTITLRLDRVDVDLEAFLQEHDDARAAAAAGEAETAIRLLERAESRHRGAFLEEDLYEDWAQTAREAIRAARRDGLQLLARIRAENGEVERAVRLYLDLIDLDRLDGQSQTELAELLERCGRHGEARRHWDGYAAARAEIGLEAVAFPVIGSTGARV